MIRGKGRLMVEAGPDGVSGLRHAHFIPLGDLRNHGLSPLMHSGLLRNGAHFMCLVSRLSHMPTGRGCVLGETEMWKGKHKRWTTLSVWEEPTV